MRFDSPWFLLLFFFLLILPMYKDKHISFSTVEFFVPKYFNYKIIVLKFLKYLNYVVLSLMILALSRPILIDTYNPEPKKGINIIVVLDISKSMIGEDFKPNRLEASKKIIENFIKERKTDKIGLIVFSGESYTKSPLTVDYDFLINKLREVEANEDEITQGTAIGVALANAVARLKKVEAKSKVVLLLTDGENNMGSIDPITSSEFAKDEGIKIYSVAVGSEGKVPYPVYQKDIFGAEAKRYVYLDSKFDKAVFKKISDITNGKFYSAEDEDKLIKIFKEIDEIEKTEIAAPVVLSKVELFPIFLNLSGVILLIIFIFRFFVLRSFFI